MSQLSSGLLFGSRAIHLLGSRVKGICLDSAPALDETAIVPATVVRDSGVVSQPWLKQLLFMMVYTIFSFLGLVGRLFGKSFSPRRYFGVQSLADAKAKKLFLFSDADEITNAAMLRKFIAEVGGDSFDFQTSKHVSHFRSFPAEYENQVRKTFFSKKD